MDIYGGNSIALTPLEEIVRCSTDEQLISMNLGSTLKVKLAIYKEYSYRNYGNFNALSDVELLEKCVSDMQLERSLALKIASIRKVIWINIKNRSTF